MRAKLGFGVVLLLGCTSSDPSPQHGDAAAAEDFRALSGGECDSDADCPPGLGCQAREFCAVPCVHGAAPCPQDGECVSDEDYSAHCIWTVSAGSLCGPVHRCESGDRCHAAVGRDARCRPSCGLDSGACPGPQECTGTGLCGTVVTRGEQCDLDTRFCVYEPPTPTPVGQPYQPPTRTDSDECAPDDPNDVNGTWSCRQRCRVTLEGETVNSNTSTLRCDEGTECVILEEPRWGACY